MKKAKTSAPARATCATTAGYIYQAWPKGKPIPAAKRPASRSKKSAKR
jgi:hypothetical protein